MTWTVLSPVTGAVTQVLVKVGDTVRAGDEMALIESMKMEFPVQATASGVVVEVLASEAQAVAEGEPLFGLE